MRIVAVVRYCLKYCIFSDTADAMSISDIRTSVSKEFGLYIPYNIAVKCLSIIENEGIIELSDCYNTPSESMKSVARRRSNRNILLTSFHRRL